MAAGQVIVTIVGNATSLSNALSTAAGDLDGFAAKADAAGKKMQSVGKGLTLGATLPIVGIGYAAFNAAQDFETAFTGVIKTVEGTDKQIAALRQGIIDMSKEIPASTTEISAIAEAAGALGIQTENVLGFTRVMIDLGETTNLTADQAASAFARIANIMQTPQDQFDEMGSTVVDLGNKTASTEAEITEMALRIAGAGKQVGLTEDQVLSFGAALASVGVDAEAGGSAISRTFIDIATAVSNGGDALTTFATVAGTSADQFATKFKTDAAGAITDFIVGLQKIQAGGGDVLKTLEDLGITEIRQRDAILRLVGAGDLLNQTLDTGKQAWADNNALVDEAAKRYGTNAAEMEKMRNKVDAALVVLGTALVPVIEKVATVVTELAEKWATLSDGTQDIIIAAAGIVAALGPVVYIVGTLTRAVGLAQTAFTTIVSGGMNPYIIGAVAVGVAVLTLKDQFIGFGEQIDANVEKLAKLNNEQLVNTVNGLVKLSEITGNTNLVHEAFGRVLDQDVVQAQRFRDAVAASGQETDYYDKKIRNHIATEGELQNQTQSATDKVNALRAELGALPPDKQVNVGVNADWDELIALQSYIDQLTAPTYGISIAVVGT